MGLSQEAFGALAGVKKNAQINYEAGRRSPDGDYLSSLGKHGVDVSYVVTGRRTPELHRRVEDRYGGLLAFAHQVASLSQAAFDQIPNDAYVPLPIHDAVLQAGTGAENASEGIHDYLAFRSDWLKRIGVQLSAAALAHAKGDSMIPAINDGDILLIDTSVIAPPDRIREPKDSRLATIYALRDDHGARVKRIERIGPGQLMLLSDNPAFPPEVKGDADISILGKVVWWGHTNTA